MTALTLTPSLPQYERLDVPQASGEDGQLPLYTPRSLQTVMVNGDYFQYPLETVQSSPSTASASLEMDYVCDSKYLRLNMGNRIWSTEHPSYGRGSSIPGYITLKNTKGIDKVIIFVEGTITTSVPSKQGAAKVPLSMFPVLRLSEVLFSRGSDKSTQSSLSPPGLVSVPPSRMGSMLNLAALSSSVSLADRSKTGSREAPSRLPFNLGLPPNSKLPPTFEEEYQEMSIKIAYKVRVELHRKWKKRDTCVFGQNPPF